MLVASQQKDTYTDKNKVYGDLLLLPGIACSEVLRNKHFIGSSSRVTLELSAS